MFSTNVLRSGKRVGRFTQRAGHGMLRILSVALVGLLAWACQAAAQPAANPVDLRYLPDQSQYVATMKLADIVGSPFFDQITKNDPNLGQQLAKIKTEAGIALQDITLITVGGKIPQPQAGAPNQMQIVAVMQTKNGYTAQQILQNMNKTATPVAVGNFTIQQLTADNAFCVAGNNQVLYGPTAALQSVLQRNGAANVSPGLQQALKDTNFNGAAAFVIDAAALKNQPGFPGGGAGGVNVVPPDAVSVEMTLAQNVTLKGFAGFTKMEDATNLAQLANAGIVAAKFNANLDQETKDLLNSIQVNAQGTKVNFQAAISPALIAKAAKGGVNPLLPMPKPQPFPAPVPQPVPGQPVPPPVQPPLVQPVPPVAQPPVAQPAQPNVPAQASVNGKYVNLLKVIDVPQDQAQYGQFNDYGHYTGTSWAGHNNLPVGYWVYVAPKWYIWEKEAGKQPAAQPGGNQTFNETGAFSKSLTINPGQVFTFNVANVQAGQVTFNVKPQFDAKLDIKVTQNGAQVAQDNGLKTNFVLSWNAQAGNATIVVTSTDNLVNTCTFALNQGGGGAVQPPPAGGVIQKNGPFTDNQNIKPNDQLTYQFPVQAGQATFTIKPQVDAILDIKVMQNGVQVAQDSGLKTNFVLNWNAAAAGNVQVQIKSTDNLTNQCAITFAQGGGAVQPPPVGGQLLNVNGNVVAGGFQMHNVNLTAGQQYTIKCKSIGGFDPVIHLINPTGQEVAADDDGDGFPNSKLIHNATATGQYQIKVRGFGNSAGMYQLTVEGAGGGAVQPPPGGVIQKNGPFTDNLSIKPNDNFTYEFPVQAGQCTFNVKPQFDAKLNITVMQNGAQVAQDVGGPIKTAFNLTWNAAAAGKVQVKIQSTDTLTNQCTIAFSQGGGVNPPPPPAGVIQKNGPFSDNQNIKPNDQLTYQFPVQAGQATFTIKPQFDAILDIKVMQNGVEVAKDSGLKTNFVLNWNAQAGATVQVQIKSTDNLTNQCTLTFAQGGAVPPPPPGGGKLLDVNGNVVAGGFQMHNVNLTAGQQYTIKCKSIGGFDPVIHLINPTGQEVAADDDGDGFPNSKLIHNATATGQYQIKVRGFGNSAGMYQLTVEGPGGGVNPPPPPGGVIQKNGPFTDNQQIKPNDEFTYQFPVQAGQATFTIKPQFDAKLDITVTQNGAQVAQDVNGGIKTNFNLTWNGAAGATAQVKIKSTDNLANQCAITFAQGGGVVPPAPAGVIQKNGPFSEAQKIKPNDEFTYQFPVQAGQATFTIKPQFDAKLDVTVTQNGAQVAQDVNGGIKTNFNLTWNGVAGATVQVKIKSTDNLENQCTISFAQGGAPVVGGQLLNVNGNVVAGGFQMHNVQLQAGQQYTIKCKSIGGFDPVIHLINPNGQEVAADDDGDGFPNSKLIHNAAVAGQYQIKVRGFGNSAGMYQLTVDGPGGGANPNPNPNPNPAPGGVIQKNGPFTDNVSIKPNDNFTYQVPVQAGQCTFNIKPQFDAILNIKVFQNGMQVAQDVNGGVKANFNLTWNATAAGNVQIQVQSTDNLTNQCTVSFSQAGGAPKKE